MADTKKRVSRMAYRCGVEAAKFKDGRAIAIQVETLVQRESERDDALDDVAECFCPSCSWIGNQDECNSRTPQNGRGHGHTPDDVELRCPKCEAIVEDIP